jgi:hypothetical protein
MLNLCFWKFPTYWFCSFKKLTYLICNIKIYNKYFIFPLKSLFLTYNKFQNFQGHQFYINNFYIRYLQYIFITWYRFLNIKVKFRHKISWIKTYYSTIPYLIIDTNKAHYFLYFISNFYLKRKKKYFTYNTLLLKGADFIFLTNIAKNFVLSFPWDKYTSRGFRLSRQRLQRRPGKVSQYSMLKTKIF